MSSAWNGNKTTSVRTVERPEKAFILCLPVSIQNIEFNIVFGVLADLNQITSCCHSICCSFSFSIFVYVFCFFCIVWWIRWRKKTSTWTNCCAKVKTWRQSDQWESMTKNEYIHNENNACFAIEHFIRNELMEKAVRFNCVHISMLHAHKYTCDGATMHADIK